MIKTIKHIISGGLAFVLALAVLDVFITQAGIVNTSLTHYDYTLGKIRPAEKSYIMFNEGFSIGKFNEGGYLYQYYPPRHSSKDSVVRVALFGDSYVEGFQVFERDHFSTLLEVGLQKKYPNRTVEVLNFGYSGFDIGDMYVYSQLIAADYTPDVMVFLLSKADFQLNYRMPYSPRVVVDSASLEIVRPYSKDKMARYNTSKQLLNFSSLANMLNKARKSTKEQILSKCFEKFYTFDSESTSVYDDLGKEASDSLGVASQLILEDLKHQLVVVNRDDLPLPEDICDKIDDLDIPYIDLSVPLQRLYDGDINPHYWEVTSKYGHWNKVAHRDVADYMVEEFSLGMISDD